MSFSRRIKYNNIQNLCLYIIPIDDNDTTPKSSNCELFAHKSRLISMPGTFCRLPEYAVMCLRAHGRTHTLRGHRMGSGMELRSGCCLRANTDGLPICHASVTGSACVFVLYSVKYVAAYVCNHERRIPSVRLKSLSRTSRVLSSALAEKRPCQTFASR